MPTRPPSTGVADIDLRTSTFGPRPPRWKNLKIPALPALGAELDLLSPEHPVANARADELAQELTEHLSEQAAEDGVSSFLAAAHDAEDLLDRRALVLLASRLMAWPGCKPRLPIPPAAMPPGRRGRRALRGLEVGLLRAAAENPTRLTLVRLLGAGANVAEAARVRTTDVHITADGDVHIYVGGGRGFHPRTLPLSPWSDHETATLLADSVDGFLIPLGPAQTDKERLEAADGLIHTLLDRTGFRPDRRVTATSIRMAGLIATAEHLGFEVALAQSGSTNRDRFARELESATAG
jgi:hypothetical protein